MKESSIKKSFLGKCIVFLALLFFINGQNQAQATGYRRNGYRPYDCTWGYSFEKQAKKALDEAAKFRKILAMGRLKDKQAKMLGTSVLMALLWAQDQGNYILTKHYSGRGLPLFGIPLAWLQGS